VTRVVLRSEFHSWSYPESFTLDQFPGCVEVGVSLIPYLVASLSIALPVASLSIALPVPHLVPPVCLEGLLSTVLVDNTLISAPCLPQLVPPVCLEGLYTLSDGFSGRATLSRETDTFYRQGVKKRVPFLCAALRNGYLFSVRP